MEGKASILWIQMSLFPHRTKIYDEYPPELVVDDIDATAAHDARPVQSYGHHPSKFWSGGSCCGGGGGAPRFFSTVRHVISRGHVPST